MTWNKKNQQFALSCGLRPSTIELAQYCLRRADNLKPTEVLLDLREFNREIGKHRIRGEYDRKTIKEAIAQLDEKTFGWFTIVKSYTWAIKKIEVRPVDYALSKKSQLLGVTPKLKRGNPMFSEAHKDRLIKQQQQEISKIDRLLKNLGLIFSPDAIRDIWRSADKKVSSVKKAIELMLYRQSTQKEKIANPCGWLRNCLRYGWQDDYDPYYQVQLPTFSTTNDIANFVEQISREVRQCPTN